jgi:hypothetical protein
LPRHVVDKESQIRVDQEARAKCAEKVCLDACLANVNFCVESKMFVALRTVLRMGHAEWLVHLLKGSIQRVGPVSHIDMARLPC